MGLFWFGGAERLSRRWLGLVFLWLCPSRLILPRTRFGLPMIMDGEMALPRYAALMIIRVVLDFLLVMGVYATLGRRLEGVPLVGPAPMRFVLIGLATGLVVFRQLLPTPTPLARLCCRLLGFCDRGWAAGHTQAQRWP
jgi:hypothetical protein